jgi:hypothetical protein
MGAAGSANDGQSILFSPAWEVPIVVAGAELDENYGNVGAANKTLPFSMNGLKGSLELAWTGDPVLSFALEGCNSLSPTPANPWASKSWNNLAPGAIPAIPNSAGTPGSHLILLNNIGSKWLRLVVGWTSGSGTIILIGYKTWAPGR